MSAAIENFELQARACARIGSPFTAELCRAIPEAMGDTGFARRVRNWAGPAGQDALALRACGGLHALVITGASPDLAAVYPPHAGDRAVLRSVLGDVIAEHDLFLTDYLDNPPQTNETARSSMILGAGLTVAHETGLPLSLYEIGASAGLNLWFSRYAYDLGNGLAWGRSDAPLTIASDWSGALPPLNIPLDVMSRRGCDRNPLSPADPEDRLRLMSYIWPDQASRMARMRQALDFVAARAPSVVAEDAADWVEAKLAKPQDPGTARLLYHTVVWQYLPEKVKARITAAIEAAGAAATRDKPLAWFRFENDQGAAGDGGLMDMRVWPGGETRVLGRADFHGRWVRWA